MRAFAAVTLDTPEVDCNEWLHWKTATGIRMELLLEKPVRRLYEAPVLIRREQLPIVVAASITPIEEDDTDDDDVP